MIYITANLERNNNAWTKNLINAAEKEFARRKIKFEESSNIEEVLDKCKIPGDVIFVPTPATGFISSIIEKCNKKGVQVIAPNAFQDISNIQSVHCVRGDIFGLVSTLVQALKRQGKEKIALYGVNSNSHDDLLLVDAFNYCYCGRYIGVYFNDGNPQECFDDFIENINDVDAIICANDYIAINLFEKISRIVPKRIDDIVIVSFSNTLLSQVYNKPFTSIAMNTSLVAKATADIYKIVKNLKPHEYCSIQIYLDYEIFERGNGKGLFSKENREADSKRFYSFPRTFDFNKAFDNDIEIAKLVKIEMMLNELSELQLGILYRIVKNQSNKEIGERMFLSGETIKYHQKKILEIFNCKSKEELRGFLDDLL